MSRKRKSLLLTNRSISLAMKPTSPRLLAAEIMRTDSPTAILLLWRSNKLRSICASALESANRNGFLRTIGSANSSLHFFTIPSSSAYVCSVGLNIPNLSMVLSGSRQNAILLSLAVFNNSVSIAIWAVLKLAKPSTHSLAFFIK